MLYPHQKESVAYHLAHHYSLNGSEMGLGKTRIALETARASGARHVAIFCPAFLKSVWVTEFESLNPIGDISKLTIVPYTQMEKFELGRPDFIIADEVHFLKNPRAQRTHTFYGILKKNKPKYFLGLTGTPIRNRLPDFWTLLGFCSLNPENSSGQRLEGDLKKYRRFCEHFCHMEFVRTKFGKVRKFGDIRTEKIEEFKALLIDKFIQFRTIDVLKDLPELTRISVRLNIAASEDLLQEEFEEYMVGRKTDIGAKTASALLKAPLTAKYCNNMLEQGTSPLLIYTDHVDSARLIHGHIPGASIVTGGTPMDLRQDYVKRFQEGSIPALIATIGSLSVGVTLTAAQHVIFNDLSWVPSDNEQALKRIHRIGQKGICFGHFMEATETDAHIRKVLEAKVATIRKVLN